jgi:hypothetical protein
MYPQSPPPASKSNAPKIANTSLLLDPVFANTSPNNGATLLFDSEATTSFNIDVAIGAGVKAPGPATVAG